MKYVLWTAAALLITGAAVAVTHSDEMGPWHRHHGPGGFPLAMLAHHLDLTDAQKTQIKSMWNTERPTVVPLLKQLANGRKEMDAAAMNGTFDAEKVQAIANRQAQTVAQLLVEKERLQSNIYTSVLTPEQRLKADKMRTHMDSHIDEFLNRLEHPKQ